MTLSTAEKTIHDGQPIELYEFLITGGDADAYRYTDHYEDLFILGNTWTALKTIQRSVVMVADAEDAPELTVDMPLDAPIVNDIIIQEPPRGVAFTVQRYHGDIANVGQMWSGKVRGVKLVGRTASFRIPSLLTSALQTIVPTITYQTLCNHVLYDGRCPVIDSSFAEIRTVTAIDDLGREITINTLLEPASEYIGGYLKLVNGDTRLIADATGLTLIILRPFRNLIVTNVLDIFQGCNHKIDTCHIKFGVLPSFGGHPQIQSIDVFRKGISGSGIGK